MTQVDVSNLSGDALTWIKFGVVSVIALGAIGVMLLGAICVVLLWGRVTG